MDMLEDVMDRRQDEMNGKKSGKIEQWMMRHLRQRGWVVFWLDERARKCPGNFCWLKLYEAERRAGR